MTLPHDTLNRALIETLVPAFYAAVRADAVLGPIFAEHVTDWPEHEAKIARFWRNALLRDPVYSGSPMMAHRAAGNVRPEHFVLWLHLFDKTARQVVPADAAADWSAVAHRIGRALKMGVEESRRAPSAVPTFF